MLLNYYLKLKSQLTSATSVTNNYFRSAGGVLTLNVVAQGSGSAFAGHLEPSIWCETRSVNPSSGSSPYLPQGSLFIPPGLQQCHVLVAVVAAQILEDPTLGHTCETQPEFQCLQPEKGKGSNLLRLNMALSRLSSPCPHHNSLPPFFFKSGWTPSWEKQGFCVKGGWALRHTPQLCSSR